MTEIGAALPRPIRIGLAKLDTSHPLGYIPVIRALGHEVTGVYDDGVVFDTSYARRFVSENGLTRRYRELSDLARDVDVAYVGGCDWTARLAAVRLLADAGVGILLDKPAAATWSDLDELEELVGSGARITGGSALLGCDEVRDWVGAHGTAVTALATCHGHELDYGVHAAALVLAVCGAGVREVRASRVDHALVVSLRWSGGQVARYVLAERPLNVEYAVTVVGDGAVDQLAAQSVTGLRHGQHPPVVRLQCDADDGLLDLVYMGTARHGRGRDESQGCDVGHGDHLLESGHHVADGR